MIVFIVFMIFCSAALLSYSLVPILVSASGNISKKQNQQFLAKMDRILQEEDIRKAQRLYIFSPPIFAALGLIFTPDQFKPMGALAGIILGFVLSRMYIQQMIQKRKTKFKNQLMDALMIMSSSFRGGLSLIQAIEAVTEEMPDPVHHEFGIVLGENKMGVSLDESFNRLYKRMPSPALQQMITAILLSRETGGNLPAIFGRIIQSIRERNKIEQNLQTLTVQGKIQAVVMTILPIFFIVGVSASNKRFFAPMLNTPDGQHALMLAAGLWIVGAFFVWKISAVTDY